MGPDALVKRRYGGEVVGSLVECEPGFERAADRACVGDAPQPLGLIAADAIGEVDCARLGEHAARDGQAWASWEDTGPGLPPLEVPAPTDLPTD
jgi:hypothetical protein